ncbi:hypothetical protein ENUP19_0340G0051 [Entamoeba nuttalli]|uniref:Uncharacterized protein n=2 Tax=Entamoeba nuttalli TaxID=412467 RepID=K2HYR1_ENTNP|nr:hypothetical protein ENU1_051720 [Entamoeba nuttalli P19]EKE41555.1 hypothetical protein ENU1_051720 [Entamoeba nuttalli P19]|eukprot:XP_008856110.1 hypothetical protein ENU1_051720 [Entamoeba nuttalli P19]
MELPSSLLLHEITSQSPENDQVLRLTQRVSQLEERVFLLEKRLQQTLTYLISSNTNIQQSPSLPHPLFEEKKKSLEHELQTILIENQNLRHQYSQLISSNQIQPLSSLVSLQNSTNSIDNISIIIKDFSNNTLSPTVVKQIQQLDSQPSCTSNSSNNTSLSNTFLNDSSKTIQNYITTN